MIFKFFVIFVCLGFTFSCAIYNIVVMREAQTQFIKETVQEGKSVTVEWEPLAPAGPCVAFHAACIIRGSLFIHGGVTEKDSKLPSSGLHKLDLKTCQWTEVFFIVLFHWLDYKHFVWLAVVPLAILFVWNFIRTQFQVGYF